MNRNIYKASTLYRGAVNNILEYKKGKREKSILLRLSAVVTSFSPFAFFYWGEAWWRIEGRDLRTRKRAYCAEERNELNTNRQRREERSKGEPGESMYGQRKRTLKNNSFLFKTQRSCFPVSEGLCTHDFTPPYIKSVRLDHHVLSWSPDAQRGCKIPDPEH